MATIASPATRMRGDRWFYTSISAATAAVIILGFAPSFYFSRWMTAPPTTPEMGILLHVHGAVFTGWIALMVIQPMLIASRNPALHRKLGYFGAGIAVAMFTVGHLAAVAAMHGGFRGLGDPYVFYAIPFLAINTFGATVALAVYWRNRADTHKRLILLAHVPLLEAAIARIPLDAIQTGAPFSFTFMPDFIIVAGMIYDWRTRGRVHRVWIWGGLAMLALQLLRFPLMGSAAWHDFAETIAGLWA